MVREVLMGLVSFIIISAAVEALLPEGGLSPFVRYFVGLLFLVVLFGMGSSFFSKEHFEIDYGSVSVAPTNFNERVIELQEEKIKNDLLQEIEGCVSVSSVLCNEDGSVERIEVVADRFLSREIISERYGLSEENVIIRGVGEQ